MRKCLFLILLIVLFSCKDEKTPQKPNNDEIDIRVKYPFLEGKWFFVQLKDNGEGEFTDTIINSEKDYLVIKFIDSKSFSLRNMITNELEIITYRDNKFVLQGTTEEREIFDNKVITYHPLNIGTQFVHYYFVKALYLKDGASITVDELRKYHGPVEDGGEYTDDDFVPIDGGE